MTQADAITQLQRDVRYLNDRLQIQDVIASQARGHDRLDADIITAAYHPDGVDEHGYAINAGPAYAEWANRVHAQGSLLHLHNITTHLCEIDGDIAHCESYVLVGLLNNDGKTARLINGRYVDRLERRDGVWKIALRRATVDLLLAGDASILQSPLFVEQGYTRGTRDKEDISYSRPLTQEAPVSRW
ncbi:nuclear transport factor 2 family protein [Sphingomonas sp. G-3-2-10]|uniref:nuclear transport factor 2 family protein n=1 Tax=Sphingomonas sp. G-3-2-10 TaxID=2728838 RepID=UPI00146D07EC|nr:nuclear transport factor 2 family protein [Sphingomonas sp. G-3-2-10]NML07072.1 nuclear transport factor 2 family protein [Sphingomonas sp. G-3-2-10]